MPGEIILSTTPGGVNAQPVFVSKSITFTGAASLGAIGNVPLFTITGQVQIVKISGYVLTNLAGANATIALGITGSTSLFIAATTATTMLTTAAFWASTTATANGIALPAALQNVIIETNVVGTVAVAGISSGVLRIDVEYKPLSAGASLA